MSKISLKHSGGNVVSLNSPTSAPTSADVAFKLPNADGTSGQAIVTDASGNLSFAGTGKILQVVEGTLTSGFTTTSQSMVDLGLSASITPSSSSNKILVLLSLGCFVNVTQHKRAFANILRGSTVLFVGDAATGEEVTIARNHRYTQDSYVMDPVSRSFLDTPSTTSATTYKVQVSVASDGGTLYVNRTNTLDANAGNTASSLILMEVAA